MEAAVEDPTKQFVPEIVLKKRNRDVQVAEQRALARKHRVTTTRGANKKQNEEPKRLEKFIKEYRQQQTSYTDIKKRARVDESFKIPSEVKVVLVMRIRGIKNLAPQVQKILKLFRLGAIYNAVLIRVNQDTMRMLKKIERYITFGYPTRKTISDLIYKRGYAKVEKQRVPLSSNEIVEKYLGEHGIICIEDIVHEVYTTGAHFKEANNFIWSFKLNEPTKALENKNKPFSKGGDWGNREEKINDLVQKMI